MCVVKSHAPLPDFSSAQRRAVDFFNGPCLVLAGPGSGKTTVITGRTRRLIEEKQIAPASILVVTFTRAAAREMQERFLTLCKAPGANLVTFGTFHSVFFSILRKAYGYGQENIITPEEKRRLLGEILSGYSLEVEDEQAFQEDILSEISLIKNQGIRLEDYHSSSCGSDVFRSIYREYAKRSAGLRKLDFDDMLLYCCELLSHRKDILSLWQKRYPYILIDEFQDINPIQYRIIRLLAAPQDNLFIVGDDDQSIYRFRGARPELMLGFPRDYPQAEKLLLDTNFRSGQAIVACAMRLISHNQSRFDKKILPGGSCPSAVRVLPWDNAAAQARHLADAVRQAHEEGVPYEQMAVLFRTNGGARYVAEALLREGIPFVLRDQTPNLYEHWIARNLRTYMRMAAGSRKRADFLQIMNRPNRYISREALSQSTVSFEELRIFYEDRTWMQERLDDWENQLEHIAGMAPFAAVNYIRFVVGYEDYLKTWAAAHGQQTDEVLDVLQEIQESCQGFKTWQDWEVHIADYTKKLKEQAQLRRDKKESVTLSTLHSSKGLEYDDVYILDVNEGSIPYHKAVLDAEIEEERRLLYVGMTRARKNLEICYLRERHEKPVEPSRFLEEIS